MPLPTPAGRRSRWSRPTLMLLAVALLSGCSTASPVPPSPTPVHVTATTSALAPATAGFSPGYRILDLDAAALARQLDLDAGNGARWIRLDLDWSTVQRTPGTNDWSAPDRVVAAARMRGLEVIALPAYTPDWARAGDGAPDPGPFAAFVAQAAARYVPLGVTTWEMWNEPNLREFWGAAPDPVAYADLLVRAAASVHAVAPRALVLSGGTAPAADVSGQSLSTLSFVRATLAALARAPGGVAAAGLDGVAVHPYAYPTMPSEEEPGAGNGIAAMPAVHELMVAHGLTASAGDRGRVWATEFGAPTGTGPRAVTPVRQAALLREGFAAVRGWPWAGPLLVYSDRDAGDDPASVQDNFGLLTLDFVPKPAWDEFRVQAAVR